MCNHYGINPAFESQICHLSNRKGGIQDKENFTFIFKY